MPAWTSRRLAPGAIEHRDLITAAAGEHQGSMLRSRVGALPRTYLLLELAQLTVPTAPSRPRSAGQTVGPT